MDDQQKLILYQNAVDYAKAHNIQLGQALTPEQLGALDKPMLWYVTQQVPDPSCLSGACPMVSALVPQVYLPPGFSGIEPGGSVVASKSLELLAGNPIRNTGTLGSYGTLTSNTTIVNEQRAAEMTAAWQPIEDGWARTTGQQGQANSGFVFAANAADIAGQIQNINGVVAQLNADGSMSAAEAARVAAAVRAGMQAVTSTHTDTFVRSPDVMGEIFSGVVIAVLAVMTGGALGPALSGLASGTFGATVTGGAVGSMTGSAIGQFAANDGINFGKLFTAGAVGALTAGIANGVTVGADGSLGTAMDWSQKVADNSLAGLAGAQSVPGTTMTQAAGSTASNIAQRVEAILVLSGANAAVNTVAYGGSFGRAFVSGLAANVAAAGAYAIGGALPGIGATGATPGSIAANIAMHGLLGCAAQSVINGNCAGGAAGAMTSAIVAPLLRDALYGDTQTAFPNADGSVIDAYRNPVFNMVAVALSSMAGGAVANALGASATAGAAAAQNEALNNATQEHQRLLTPQAGNGDATSPGELANRFGRGVVGGLKGVFVEPFLQARDIGVAGLSFGYNELIRGENAPYWYPEMKSGVAQAYANGTSQGKLLLQSNPLTGVGVLSYDATTALMQGRYGDVAEMAGGAAAGMAVGAATQRYGGYGLSIEDIGGPQYGPLARQRGAINFRLVTPEDGVPNSGRYGGNPELLKWDLSEQAGIPKYIDLSKPDNIWGLDGIDLLTHYRLRGFDGDMRPPKAGTSGKAQFFDLEGHPDISSVQMHPGGGVHEGLYYKFIMRDGSEVKVIDPSNYNPRTVKQGTTFFDQQGQRIFFKNGKWIKSD